MGRHRGSKERTGEALLERHWRRLHAAGKLSESPGSPVAPWLDADALVLAAIHAVPGRDLSGHTWTRAERETLCELAVNACELDGRRLRLDIEQLADAIAQHGVDKAWTCGLLRRLAAAYPAARISIE